MWRSLSVEGRSGYRSPPYRRAWAVGSVQHIRGSETAHSTTFRTGDQMSDRPVFIYAATYSDRVDAFADYEGLLELHAAKLVGTYDVALIVKDSDGKVHVAKHEKPTQHGAWGGIAVGALVGVLFPPSIVGAAVVGGVVGGVGGHLRKGIARGDAKELGELLDTGQAALVVIGES